MEAVQGRALRDMEMHMDDVVRWNTAECTERGVTEAAHYFFIPSDAMLQGIDKYSDATREGFQRALDVCRLIDEMMGKVGIPPCVAHKNGLEMCIHLFDLLTAIIDLHAFTDGSSELIATAERLPRCSEKVRS